MTADGPEVAPGYIDVGRCTVKILNWQRPTRRALSRLRVPTTPSAPPSGCLSVCLSVCANSLGELSVQSGNCASSNHCWQVLWTVALSNPPHSPSWIFMAIHDPKTHLTIWCIHYTARDHSEHQWRVHWNMWVIETSLMSLFNLKD